ncbi:GntR family transcriptional regulator [Leucobacter tenebrionis]|uniref:GntR family transcriptional regulator n=1 Tax=Leucobacter tenebrionis TaxID=2873270 RepID=UPI001CA76AE4|nr:GntR family transcriptional regulator [Leucobacter tenebrionis]QZY53096.1 GntR family transcriptional regulator [Leucobacter tenebrionis]
MTTPKYLQIAERIRTECGTLHEGAQLPAEQELAAAYRASPMTVRRALDLLQEQGVVTRIPGRGTFVRHGIISKSSALTSFTEDITMRGMTPGTRVLGVDEVTPTSEVSRDLSLGRTELVLQLERLRFADDEPICLEVAHVPQRYAKALGDSALVSLHRGLASIGLAPDSATRRVHAAIVTDRQATLLGVPPGSPTLNIIQVFFDERGRPIQRSNACFRADRYETYSRVRRAENHPPTEETE